MDIIKLSKEITEIVKSLNVVDVLQFGMIIHAYNWILKKIKESKKEVTLDLTETYLKRLDTNLNAMSIELKSLSNSVISRQASDQVELNYIKSHIDKLTVKIDRIEARGQL
jgi:hypothetical protein